MSIDYKCRHCEHVIGQLDRENITESQLGINELSTDDKKEMIQYQSNGDIHIQTICENCEDSLGKHPQYHELDYFLQ